MLGEWVLWESLTVLALTAVAHELAGWELSSVLAVMSLAWVWVWLFDFRVVSSASSLSVLPFSSSISFCEGFCQVVNGFRFKSMGGTEV